MKRDMDLVRKILFVMEESNQILYSSSFPPEVEGHSENEIIYHMMIMSQANLLSYEKEIDEREVSFGIQGTRPHKSKHINENYSISWQGHEFLNALRDDTRWRKVKDTMVKAGGFVLDVAVSIGKEYIRREAMNLLPSVTPPD